MKKVLIIVDVQNDFVEGGALAVQGGLAIVPKINELMNNFDLIVATQDWHPANHKSFAANHSQKSIGEIIDLNGLTQVLWPVHCVQHEKGSEFVQTLNTSKIHRVFQKGQNPEIDSYSGFYDNGKRQSTGLSDFLRHEGVKAVYICGIATDYCVKYTALDAVNEGFKVYLYQSACKGVNLAPDDVEKALDEMYLSGVKLLD